MERRHLMIASAIVLAGVLISASLLVTVGGTRVTETMTTSETSVSTTVSTIISTEQCTPVLGIVVGLIDVAPVDALVNVAVPNDGGLELFNATVTGYSGSKQVFSQCYVGANVAEVIPWNAPDIGNWTSVKITAQKMEANDYNLTLSSHGVVNSTVAPFGFVSISTVPYHPSSG
jgi:hypothetical protein